MRGTDAQYGGPVATGKVGLGGDQAWDGGSKSRGAERSLTVSSSELERVGGRSGQQGSGGSV